MFKHLAVANRVNMHYSRRMDNIKSIVNDLSNAGYTQQALGKIAGVSQMTISRWKTEPPRRVNKKALKRLINLHEKISQQ